MRLGIHPDYHPVEFQERTAGDTFLTRSIATSTGTIEWTGGNHLARPLVTVEISSWLHPLWTGQQPR